MVETVYDLCQPSMFTTTFPDKRGSSFFFPLGNSKRNENRAWSQVNMKVIKAQSDLKPSYFPMESLGKTSSVTAKWDRAG